MAAIWNTLKDINYSGIPVTKILVVIVILVLTQTLRRFIIAGIIQSIERFTRKTDSKLDDELIAIIKPSLSWTILIGGL